MREKRKEKGETSKKKREIRYQRHIIENKRQRRHRLYKGGLSSKVRIVVDSKRRAINLKTTAGTTFIDICIIFHVITFHLNL